MPKGSFLFFLLLLLSIPPFSPLSRPAFEHGLALAGVSSGTLFLLPCCFHCRGVQVAGSFPGNLLHGPGRPAAGMRGRRRVRHLFFLSFFPFFSFCLGMSLYRALRGYSCGSRGFLRGPDDGQLGTSSLTPPFIVFPVHFDLVSDRHSPALRHPTPAVCCALLALIGAWNPTV